jgi:hypothetical protein
MDCILWNNITQTTKRYDIKLEKPYYYYTLISDEKYITIINKSQVVNFTISDVIANRRDTRSVFDGFINHIKNYIMEKEDFKDIYKFIDNKLTCSQICCAIPNETMFAYVQRNYTYSKHTHKIRPKHIENRTLDQILSSAKNSLPIVLYNKDNGKLTIFNASSELICHEYNRLPK